MSEKAGLYVVGSRAEKLGAKEVVTGKEHFVADLSFPGTLVGKLLYTRHPFARIKKLDVTAARKLPGVAAVLTHQDIPGENSFLHIIPDQPLLCSDTVRYQGDAVACVAAETEEAAQSALAAIEVDYEPLVGVFDVLEAIKPGTQWIWGDRPNMFEPLALEIGNLAAGFDEADVIVENTYSTHLVEHAFLETEGALALLDPMDGTMVVYTCTQWPYQDRLQIARALKVPLNRVRVVVPSVGGGFGGKVEAHVEVHAALLAQATGKPVRIIRSREESILTHVKRHPVVVEYKTGAKSNGKITALHAKAYCDTGPYANAGLGVFAAVGDTLSGPYNIPNVRLESYLVLTNNPICGAMRGYGITQSSFAYEAQMEAVARELGIDPVELRLKNGLVTGNKVAAGTVIRKGCAMRDTLRKAAELAGWKNRRKMERQPEPHLRRGQGLAVTWHTVGLGRSMPDQSSVTLEMATDGTVTMRTGVVEQGQGTHTVLAQLAAEALGVEVSAIKVFGPDTSSSPDAASTEATRQTYVSGNATLRAAKPIEESLLQTASEMTGFPKDTLSFHKGRLYREGEALQLSVAEAAKAAYDRNRQLVHTGFYKLEYIQDYAPDAYTFNREVFIYSADVATVLVDTETGEIVVEEMVSVHAPGRVVNPQGAVGQVTGGTSMGLGYALTEELIVDQGRTENLTLDSYLIPTAKDLPPIKVSFVETPEPYGPMGASGLGEAPVNPVAPAIRNAVWDAIGVAINDLPLTPERVLSALRKQAARGIRQTAVKHDR